MKEALFVLLIFLVSNTNAQVLRKRVTQLMGSRFEISIVAEDSLSAERYIDTVIAEVSRIENLISDWKPDSQISKVNKNAGIRPVQVDPEVFALTERALHVSEITGGAFDISFAAMERVWKFDGSMTEMPTAKAIKKSVKKVGYKHVILDKKNGTIFLKRKGMKIGFGATGKGYAADHCRDRMISMGVQAGIINASGDMSAWGKQPDGSDWLVGIANPMEQDTILAVVPLSHGAVTTSGNYEQFVVFNGIRYSHIINPATGYPATGLCSVTVFGPSAEVANGFSTSIMVLGKDKGMALMEQYPDYKCILITDDGTVFSTPNIASENQKLPY
ncbi:FAD:protein FMN transferase [Olivibacter sitiensis]|uniref:FAD:protein FMN transferase n=1 Tax=Olivibacter sitiensis TaxID=376470 RepID=UPI0003FC3444|nr:FAD:protein FMN transferase [Olivibacter sitiensis]